MVTIVYRVVTKSGQADAFKKLASHVLIPEAQKSSGCRLFSLFQNAGNQREFIFYEKWDSQQNILAYKKRLIALLGDPHPGEEFPARMNDLIDEDEDLV